LGLFSLWWITVSGAKVTLTDLEEFASLGFFSTFFFKQLVNALSGQALESGVIVT